jgi:outer membrane murein-binding lipoprotein Lpp
MRTALVLSLVILGFILQAGCSNKTVIQPADPAANNQITSMDGRMASLEARVAAVEAKVNK